MGHTSRIRRSIGGAVALVVIATAGSGGVVASAAAARPAAALRHVSGSAARTDDSTSTTGATRDADVARTGWYPDQTNLSPQLVAGGTFGQLFSTPVNGSVYGQPLVDDGQLLVTTENNAAYGLDPVTGAVLWSRQFGSPASAAAIGCADLAPNMGISGTPVVDTATDTEYLVDNEYLSGDSGPEAYYMHALNLAADGAEEPGFPVRIQGSASNNPSVTFNPTNELQRPGLLLMNGVVYVGFGAHCDITPWEGWIVGVSEAGALTTMWTTMSVTGDSGGGVWMSGGGLVSDGPGQILFATGNENESSTTGPTPGSSPPADLGESVVRLTVQPDGSLEPTDFFMPYDASTLDQNDLDFGSGSPVALPDAYFGTSSIPHLAVEVGKEGYVYLLNRDALGGFEQGPSDTDAVVGRYGPNGGVWSSPAVWPGDGGWIYIPTASGSAAASGSSGLMDAYQYGVDGSGNPTLDLAGTSSDAFGFGSSSPVVTSDGTTSGSALMWTVWSPDGTGAGAQLRAYDPVPVDGVLQLVWSAPIGTASKFNPPGVADNRLYVGTRSGTVVGFGAPVAAPVTAPSPSFPTTVVGQSSTRTLTVTANSPVTVSALTLTGPFTAGTPSIPLPATLATNQSMTVPITFTPTAAGPEGGGITLSTTASGSASVALSGLGELDAPDLASSTLGVSFGGIAPGQQSSQTVSFTNSGSGSLTITGVTAPTAPFGVIGAPSTGAVLAPGAQVVVNVTFAPTAEGTFADSLVVDSTGGDITVSITGNSGTPGLLTITPSTLDFGPVPVGRTATLTFTLDNVGGSALTVTKSKPPVLGPFAALSTLPEGTVIQPGASDVETIAFTPSALGPASDGWVINATDGQGLRTVTVSGTGVLGDPGAGGWDLNGAATDSGGRLLLTSDGASQAGSAVASTPVATSDLDVTFTTSSGVKGAFGDGVALVLGDPTDPTTSVGATGTGTGFAGIPGLAVVFGSVKQSGTPSANYVGVTDGPVAGEPKALHWLATAAVKPSLLGPVAVRVTVVSGVVTVYVKGVQVLSTPVTVGPTALLGFTGSTGTTHTSIGTEVVSAVSVTGPGTGTVVGDPASGGWVRDGSSSLSAGSLLLTKAGLEDKAGSAFWPVPVDTSDLSVSFTATIGGGGTSGADGLALVLADPTTPPKSVGADGGGLGFSGIDGVAVALDTYQNNVNPSANFVGATTGPITPSVPDELDWLATDDVGVNLRSTNTVTVTLVSGVLTVSVDGTVALTTPVTVGPQVLLGFTGGEGMLTDNHLVSGVSASAD